VLIDFDPRVVKRLIRGHLSAICVGVVGDIGTIVKCTAIYDAYVANDKAPNCCGRVAYMGFVCITTAGTL